MLPPLLHGVALLLAILIQTTITPIAGAWFWVFFLGCAVLLAGGYPEKDRIWWASLCWFLAMGFHCFIIQPVMTGAQVLWMLAAMPMLALCIPKKHLKSYIRVFGAVVTLYAAGLIAQWLVGMRYTLTGDLSMSVHGGWSWPLLDSNNAAAVVNAGLIGSFYLALAKNKAWWLLFALFAMALGLTHSRAGFIGAGLGCFMVLWAQGYLRLCLTAALGIPAVISAALLYRPEFVLASVESFNVRLVIWKECLRLLWLRPWDGLGIGAFGYYYAQVRQERITGGAFAHNDFLQFAIEMGFPVTCVFIGLIIATVSMACRQNMVAMAYMTAVLAMSMVEFYFYVPPVSMLMGLALAYHRLTCCDKRNIMLRRR